MVSHVSTVLFEEPLPLNDLEKGLEAVYQKRFKQNLSQHVQLALEHIAARTKKDQKSEESQKAEELLSFARSDKYKKILHVITEEVPSIILPDGCSAAVHDIRISKKGPDDSVYEQYPEIRSKIPRGTSVLQWNSRSQGSWSCVIIYGHKKFTGGIGDEDETQPESNEAWRSYFVADPSLAKKVVCMEKVNGEAAHISGRYIDGQFYLVVGSKNVHMLIRGKMDVDLYKGSRYEYAKIIARTVCNTLESLDQQKLHLVTSLLHHSRCTLTGEILQAQSQHIVNLSHLEQPKVYIISMTPTYSGHKVDSLMAIPPHHLLDLCSTLSFHTAAYTVVPAGEIMDHKEEIRRQRDIEGEVFYYLDENENTIGLVKLKTVWYIVLRALREKVVYSFTTAKKKPGWDMSERIRGTHKRFREIQKWLKFSDEYLENWQNLAEQFMWWLNKAVKEGAEDPGRIRPAFPVLWKEFLRTTGQSDNIDLEYK